MKGAVLFLYWFLTVAFGLTAVFVPVCVGLAIWTEDGRWMWTAALSAGTAFCSMCLAATFE